MSSTYLPPREFLVECFDYDPATGDFHWKQRPLHHFPNLSACKMWNTQNAGKKAFKQLTAEGYRRTELRYEGRRIRARASRVAFKIIYDEEPEQVDHKDRNPGNDAISNLRAATQQQNQFNTAGWSGRNLPKGVYYDQGRLRAAIWRGGRGGCSVKLGSFDTVEAASAAYRLAAKRLQGDFFPEARPAPNVRT